MAVTLGADNLLAQSLGLVTLGLVLTLSLLRPVFLFFLFLFLFLEL